MHAPYSYVALHASALTVMAGTGVVVVRRRARLDVAGPLAAQIAGLGTWVGLLLAQAMVHDEPLRVGLGLACFPVATATVGAFVLVAITVSGRRPPGAPFVAALAVVPVAMAGVAALRPSLLFRAVRYGAGELTVPFEPGPAWWGALGYGGVLCTVAAGLLTAAVLTERVPLRRRPLIAALGMLAVPVVAVVASLPRGVEVGPDLVAVAGSVVTAAYCVAGLRLGLLRRLPVARDAVLENVGDAIFVLDPGGRVVDVNLAGRELARRTAPDLGDVVGRPVARYLTPGRHRRVPKDGQLHLDLSDGPLDLDLRVTVLTGEDGALTGRVVVVRDVTELGEQRRRLAEVNERLMDQLRLIDTLRHQLAELAVRDELTGLHNRRHLGAQLDAELQRCRTLGRPLSVVLIDIDHFKSVNDRHGHGVGDLLLAGVARSIASGVNAGDTVARYGGEEFVVLLPRTGLEEGIAVAEWLRERCANVVVDSRNGPVSTTVSAGVAAFPSCGASIAQLLQSADDALYAAKRSGRNRVAAGLPQDVTNQRPGA